VKAVAVIGGALYAAAVILAAVAVAISGTAAEAIGVLAGGCGFAALMLIALGPIWKEM
jgi:hypothetical protein